MYPALAQGRILCRWLLHMLLKLVLMLHGA